MCAIETHFSLTSSAFKHDNYAVFTLVPSRSQILVSSDSRWSPS